MSKPNARKPRADWLRSFEVLRRFVRESARWPKSDERLEGICIGQWCTNQRQRRSILTNEQVRLLDELGFRWEPEDGFLEMFEELRRYRKTHPDEWPRQKRGTPYHRLACWLSKARTKARKGMLSSERIKMLEEIGVSFELEWGRNFQLLKEYKERRGRLPNQRESYKGLELGQWCTNQRYLKRNGDLENDRVAALDSIGFTWEPYEEEWLTFYKTLANYREEKPNRWPASTEEFKRVKIGSWCVGQRVRFRRGGLSDKQFALLERIEFPWIPEHSPKNLPDLTGLKFHRLSVLAQADSDRYGKRIWKCLCECGNLTNSSTYCLKTGKKQSCGCLLREKAAERMPQVQKLSSELRLQTAEEVQTRIDKIHGKGRVTLVKETYKNAFTLANFHHWVHGGWEAKPINVYRGSSHPLDGREKTNAALEARKLTEEEINSRLPEFVRIMPGSFLATSKKAVFIDTDYGEWRATVSNVLGGSHHPKRGNVNRIKAMEQTNLERYGVKYTAQVPEFAMKAIAKQNTTYRRTHWKTGVALACKGMWEAAVVDYLNLNQRDFEWQPKIFTLPEAVMTTPRGNPTTYRPDFYLKDKDIWVEIKGFFRPDSATKWAWFISEYPNSELWDYQRLKGLGIIK